MADLIEIAVEESSDVINNSALQLLNHASFEYQTHDEAQKLAYLISYSFPQPKRVLSGLSEAFINAIEHGNLGIGFQNKGLLLRNKNFDEEIKSLLSKPENQSKKVRVTLEKNEHEISITIKDEGKGFDWNEFISNFQYDKNITQPNGRGIAFYIMQSFDEVEYLGDGNAVRCKVKIKK